MPIEQNSSKKKHEPIQVKIVGQEMSEYEKYQIAPVKIMNYLEVQKEAKFSLRTLLSLSVLTIAIVTFDIVSNSQLAGFSIKTEHRIAFSIFMFFVILVQHKITWRAYKLYEPYIDNSIRHLESKITRIKQVLNGIPKRKDLDTEAKKTSHKAFMETKLFNFEKTLKYSNKLYKDIDGIITFGVARFALVSILVFMVTHQSIYYWITSFYYWIISILNHYCIVPWL